MKRILFAVALAGLCSSSLAGGAVTPTVKTASIETLGKVVVSSTGRTLYHYLGDRTGKATCAGACSKQWPPLLMKAGSAPVAGTGITAKKLTLVKRADGTLQVAYGGLALYMFAGDAKSGDANGEAISNKWYAVSPAAKIVKATTTPPASSSGGLGSSGYTSTTSGSPGYDPNY